MRNDSRKLHILTAVLGVGLIAGCTSKSGGGDNAPAPQVAEAETSKPGEEETTPPQVVAKKPGKVTIPSRELPIIADDGERITMPNGEYIAVEMVEGKAFIPVEAAFDEAAFGGILNQAKLQSTNEAERLGRLQATLNRTIEKLRTSVALTRVKSFPSIGYFTALVALDDFQGLDAVVDLPADIVVNPVFVQPMDDRSVRAMSDEDLAALGNPRAETSSFSGLKRIGVPEFLATVESELGVTPDGAGVKVGVTDTGITYSHPSFMNADGESRISYMKEFTGEGRILFHPDAKFELTIADDGATSIVAEVLPPTEGTRLPAADALTEISGTIQLPEDLLALLQKSDVVAKLGVMSEASYAGIDLNQNNKTNDTTYALLIAEAGSYSIYYDAAGELDFRNAKALRDFNATGDTMELVAEIFGFDIRTTTLRSSDGETEVEVVGAGIVGFDPGAHGSHVAGRQV